MGDDNILGVLQVDVSGRRGVDEKVAVDSGALRCLGVQVVAFRPRPSPRVVAVDDAGPVLVLVVARSGELEVGKGGRDQSDADKEASLVANNG